MPWCFLWISIICFLSVQCFAETPQEVTNESNPNALNLNPDFDHSKKDNLAQNATLNTGAKLTENSLNSTDSVNNLTHNVPSWMIPIKSGALQRTGFLVLGFMIIILLFFVVRSVRIHLQKKSKSRKYGVITSSDMEMVPLDNGEDEEEEMTLFDVKHKFLK